MSSEAIWEVGRWIGVSACALQWELRGAQKAAVKTSLEEEIVVKIAAYEKLSLHPCSAIYWWAMEGCKDVWVLKLKFNIFPASMIRRHWLLWYSSLLPPLFVLKWEQWFVFQTSEWCFKDAKTHVGAKLVPGLGSFLPLWNLGKLVLNLQFLAGCSSPQQQRVLPTLEVCGWFLTLLELLFISNSFLRVVRMIPRAWII